MKKMGLRMPAEWEEHEATWLGWPHNKADWPGKFTPIPWVFGEIVKKISEGEKVRIITETKEHKIKAEFVLKSAGAMNDNVEFFIAKSDRGWMRDSGPAFVKSGRGKKEVSAVCFRFNGWAKYANHKKDEKLSAFISGKTGTKKIVPELNGRRIVLEGGSIDINGRGTLVTTEECLMDNKIQVRNPGFAKSDYESVFKKYLGIKNVLWLGNGIAGDDTHGHVDDLCRFVNPKTLLLVRERNKRDANHKPLEENWERVKDFKLENGRRPEIIELPMPEPVIFKGERLPASYANFYISNSAVLVPTFNDPSDKVALGILNEIFGDRKVVGIHAVDLVWGLGTLHCLTHEQPK